MEKENSERNAEDKALNDRIDKEIRDRQDAVSSLESRSGEKMQFFSVGFLQSRNIVKSVLNL